MKPLEDYEKEVQKMRSDVASRLLQQKDIALEMVNDELRLAKAKIGTLGGELAECRAELARIPALEQELSRLAVSIADAIREKEKFQGKASRLCSHLKAALGIASAFAGRLDKNGQAMSHVKRILEQATL